MSNIKLQLKPFKPLKLFQGRLSDFLIIVILGLCPVFFWFKPDMIITSGDIALPIGLKRWLNEFYLWHSFRNLGQDMHTVISTVIFFSLPACLSFLNLTYIFIQKIQFTLLFMLTGFSMYFFITQLYKGSYQRIIYLISVIFYMFNLYLEPIWGGFNVANLSAYIALPWLAGILIKFIEGRVPLFKMLFMTALVSLIFASTAVNPPLLLAIMVVLGACFLVYAFKKVSLGDISSVKKNFKKIFLFLLVILLISAFWILPQIGEIFLFSPLKAAPIRDDTKAWLAGISTFSSIANTLRFQCHWAWYGGWNEPYVPYAHLYKDNLFLIISGWFIPVLAVFGMLFCRFRYKYLFVSMTIISLVLSMGGHEPFGFIYFFLTKWLPYFWIIRSPWYKFTLLTAFGYAVFLGFACREIYEFILKLKFNMVKKKTAAVLFVMLSAGIIMCYAFPVTFGRVFITKEERKILKPSYTKVPAYVFEANDWLEKKKDFGRTIVLPSNTARIYDWDYVYPGPILSQISTAAVISPSYSNIFSSQGEAAIQQFYKSLYSSLNTDAQKILKLMSVRYLLHEKDVIYNYLGEGFESPEFVKEKLERQKNIKFVKNFGAWDFYETESSLPHIYALPDITLVRGCTKALFYLTVADNIKSGALFFSKQHDSRTNKFILEVNKFNSIVTVDSAMTDMIFDYSDEKSQFNLNTDVKKINFYAEGQDDYLFWAHRSANIKPSDKLAAVSAKEEEVNISIDAENFKIKKVKTTLFNVNVPWTKMTELYLKKGRHRIEFKEDIGEADKIFIISRSLYDKFKDSILNNLSAFKGDLHLISTKNSAALEPVYPDEENIEFAYSLNFTPQKAGEDNYFWMGNNENEVSVFNPKSEEMQANIKFTVYSPQVSRVLCIKLNGQDIPLYPNITNDVPADIFLLNIVLRPGKNSLNFLNYANAVRYEDLNVSFGFRDFKTVKFESKIKIDLPREGNYDVKMYPEMQNISLNGLPFNINAAGEKNIYFKKGEKEFSFSEPLEEDFFISLAKKREEKSVSADDPKLKFEMLKPVKYKIESESHEPFFLVFNESFHPGWRLSVNKKPLSKNHFSANAYANGWYIDETGKNEIILEYFPQRLFNIGALISSFTFAGLGVLFAGSLFWKRKM